MSLVFAEDRASVRMITYANAPFGTMTGSGAAELYGAVATAVNEPSVRVIIITGGVPGIFIRHYDVGELSDAAEDTSEFR
jgi:enoyl-CoA hydratase/carnithine racemase